MELNHNKIFFGMGLVALFLVSVAISQYFNTLRKAGQQKIRLTQIGSLHFKGKVISSRVYKYYGKNCYQVCLKLDTPGEPDFYIFNELDFIRIKNGIATFAAGYLDHTLGVVDSVAVNINNSGKVVFHYKGYVRDEFPLGFDAMGLKQEDMNGCDPVH